MHIGVELPTLLKQSEELKRLGLATDLEEVWYPKKKGLLTPIKSVDELMMNKKLYNGFCSTEGFCDGPIASFKIIILEDLRLDTGKSVDEALIKRSGGTVSMGLVWLHHHPEYNGYLACPGTRRGKMVPLIKHEADRLIHLHCCIDPREVVGDNINILSFGKYTRIN